MRSGIWGHMRCFNHSDREAVGSCKYCCKGLCPDCCADLPGGIACRAKHEQQVERIDAMVDRARQVQSTAARARYVAPSFFLLMGVAFIVYNVFFGRGDGLLTTMGVGFSLFGAALLAINLRAYGGRPNV
jgi:hypothetical protein